MGTTASCGSDSSVREQILTSRYQEEERKRETLRKRIQNWKYGPRVVTDAGGEEITDERVMIVVDPVNSGYCIAKRLESCNIKQILIWSNACTPEIQEDAPPEEEPIEFIASLHEHDFRNIDQMIEEIISIAGRVEAIYIGWETGVYLGEELSTKLKIPGNDSRTTHLRTNKHHQQEACKNAGINHIKQRLCHTMEDVDTYLRKCRPDPITVIVKPPEGSSSVGIVKCYSREEVRKAAKHNLDTANVFGMSNVGILLQEFLMGKEYAVNTVSVNGQHKITEMWEYDKREYKETSGVYFSARLMREYDDRAKKLKTYALKVLDAVEMRTGCCHMELIWDKIRGPILVETNCRLHGDEGGAFVVSEKCTGYSQLSVYVDTLINRKYFKQVPDFYDPRSYGRLCYFRAPASGFFKKTHRDTLYDLEDLTSYCGDMLLCRAGDTLEQTKDAYSRPGMIYLVNESEQQLNRDYEFFNKANDDLFVIDEGEE